MPTHTLSPYTSDETEEFIDGFDDCAGEHPPTHNTIVSLYQYLTYQADRSLLQRDDHC
jgi:hypothetical protein